MRNLALDIGNTAVTYGYYADGRLLRSGSSLFDDIPKISRICLKSGVNEELHIVISSVVPKNMEKIRNFCKSHPQIKLWIAGRNLPVPVRHKYRGKKLGIDRLVNIYGALRIHRPPVLVIDYGTAVTFDYLSAGGVFEGGMILPGPEISFQALIEKAALLPKKMRLPKKTSTFLGKTTYECMSSGILEGYGALTDGLVARFRSRFGRFFTLATGGFAGHLKPYTSSFDLVDPLHSVKSLLLLFKASV